jgi:polar amino acid transport system substrate-binding protein
MKAKTGRLALMAMLLMLLAAGLLWWHRARSQDLVWQRLQQGGSLRVAMDPSFPPFDTLDAQGQVAGLDVDLARALGQWLHVPVRFIPIAFDGLADAVIAGKADVVISAFPLDERLTEDVRYSQPYFDAGLLIVVPAQSTLSRPEALSRATVAVEWGGQGDAWARAQELPHVLRTETAILALQAVQTGQADAALVDAVSAALWAGPDMKQLTPPLVSEPYVMVLPANAPKLAAAVDDFLREVMANGRWQVMMQRHFRH